MSGIANTQSPCGAVVFNSHRTEGENRKTLIFRSQISVPFLAITSSHTS